MDEEEVNEEDVERIREEVRGVLIEQDDAEEKLSCEDIVKMFLLDHPDCPEDLVWKLFVEESQRAYEAVEACAEVMELTRMFARPSQKGG